MAAGSSACAAAVGTDPARTAFPVHASFCIRVARKLLYWIELRHSFYGRQLNPQTDSSPTEFTTAM
jgi:hypothetical protein